MMLSEPVGGFCSVQTNTGPPEYRKWRRGHGLQLPLHPQQVVGWLALGFSVVTCYLVVIPGLRATLQPALLTIFSVLFLSHLISHVTALLLDPADPALRRLKQKQPVPEFDRSKHAHVIENGRCHLCNIQTSGPRTKHCSVCNKCVAKFDHHCKWLNHCIGGRNYAPFLMCVTSAVVTAIAVLIVCLGEIVLYYVNPQWLAQWSDVSQHVHVNETSTPQTPTESSSNSSTTGDSAFLIIVGALGVLAAITAGLLLHLCFFHLYISFLGLTTYEYIRAYRPNLMSTAPPSIQPSQSTPSVEIANGIASSSSTINTSNHHHHHRPSTLHCCDRKTRTANLTFFTSCAIIEESKCMSSRSSENSNGCCSKKVAKIDRNDENSIEDPQGIDSSKTHVLEECSCCITVNEISAVPRKSPVKKAKIGKWNCCASVPDSPDEPHVCAFQTDPGQNPAMASTSTNPADSNSTNIANSSRPRRRRRQSRAALRIRLLFRVLTNLRTRRRAQQSNNNLLLTNSNPYRNNQVVPLKETETPNNGHPSVSEISSRVIPLHVPPPVPARRRLINHNGLNSSQLLDNLNVLRPSECNNRISNFSPPDDFIDNLISSSIENTTSQNYGEIRRYRRRRRHTILHNRPKSPTLSPIHESGLSNPASPVPCRHSVCSLTTSITNSLINSTCVENIERNESPRSKPKEDNAVLTSEISDKKQDS